jgi:NADPH:quinone reductase-like Zn-dependent oxidoreductase
LSILGDILRQQWISVTGAAKIVGGLPRIASGDLGFLKRLIEAGRLRTVIDRRYSLDDIAEGFRYAGAGHKKGHVVINIAKAA